MNLSRARCTNHEGRQASGLCPTCSRPFCRECLTEHGGRLSCASCLKRSAPAAKTGIAWKKKLAAPAMLAAAMLLSWFVFYVLGNTLELSTSPDRPAPASASPERAAPAQGERL